MNGLQNNPDAAGVDLLPPPALDDESRARNRKRVTLAAMCLATFVAILDTTVVNLALHAIQADLHTSLAALQWVIDAYNPEGQQLDFPGQLLAVAGLGLLALTFTEGPLHGWSSLWIRFSAIACAACLITFWMVERSRPGGLLTFDVFGNRMFRAAFADAVLMTFGIYSLLFIFPLYLQGIRGDSAILTGAMLLPLSLTYFAVSPFAGRLFLALGPRAAMP